MFTEEQIKQATAPSGDKLFGNNFRAGLVVKIEEKTHTAPSSFDPEKMENVYVLGCEDGKMRELQTGNRTLVLALVNANVGVGDFVKLTVTGEGTKTTYIAEKVVAPAGFAVKTSEVEQETDMSKIPF